MEKKKINYGLTLYLFVIIFFIIHGLIFFGVGMMLLSFGAANRSGDTGFLYLFLAVGVIGWSISGAAFFLLLKRKKKINDLLENGRLIYAKIDRIEEKGNIRINGSSAYRIKCRYIDPISRGLSMFDSRLLYKYPNGLSPDAEIPVYVDGQNHNEYFVDIDAVL